MYVDSVFKSGSCLVLFFIIAFFPQWAKSSHIVGGEIIYTYKSHSADNTRVLFDITLNLYRDPEGIDYDSQVDFGIYRQTANGDWEVYDVVRNIPIGPVREIQPHTNPCRTLFINSTKLEATTYTFELELEVSNYDYMISYQKCCRNYTINNIDYDRVGAVYDVIISPDAQRLGNSSPFFTEIPPHFICMGYDVDITTKAIDTDGDSIAYSFCNPIYPAPHDVSPPRCCGCTTPDPLICPPNYLELEFVAPYSSDNPLGGAPMIGIDAENGLLHGVPTTLGSYVLAICIEEYRDGVLLSTVRRDFEFNVIPCSERLVAEIERDSFFLDPVTNKEVAYFESCDDLTFDIVNLSTDENFIKSYTWNISSETQSRISTITGPDLRNHTIEIPQWGTYFAEMILNDSIECKDTTYMKFFVPEPMELDFEYDHDPCVAGPIQFSNLSQPDDIQYTWDMGDGTELDVFQPTYQYDKNGFYELTLVSENEIQCRDTLTKQIEWNPHYAAPLDTLVIDTLICYHDSIFVYDRWVRSTGTFYDYIPSLHTGCDSMVHQYNVEMTPYIFPQLFFVELCEGDPYLFHNRWIEEPGIYYDTLSSYQQCDSIVGIEFTQQEHSVFEYSETICYGEQIQFGASFLDQPGIYYDTLQNSRFCDSLVILHLDVDQEILTNISEDICDNDVFVFQGENIVDSGTYNFLLESYTGCDSLVELQLSIYPSSYTTIFDTICGGDKYQFGNQEYFLTGSYTQTLSNVYGCDSLVTLELYVAENLSRINIDEELEEEYGATLYLEPEIIGPELISNVWYESDSVLSNSIELEYQVKDENWIYFESVNIFYCVALDSVFVKSRIEKDIYIPNVFTPDGDSFNDNFYLGASPTLAASKLYVFDRWGNNMYEGDKVFNHQVINHGWDGDFQGKPAEMGTYTYMFELLFIDGSSEVVAGTFHLVR